MPVQSLSSPLTLLGMYMWNTRCGLLPNNTTFNCRKKPGMEEIVTQKGTLCILLGFFRAAVSDSWWEALAEGCALN